jgi:hypothetical protein
MGWATMIALIDHIPQEFCSSLPSNSRLYINPNTDQFWAIDGRLFDPDTEGKTKLDPVEDMLLNAPHHKALPYRSVLRDTW